MMMQDNIYSLPSIRGIKDYISNYAKSMLNHFFVICVTDNGTAFRITQSNFLTKVPNKNDIPILYLANRVNESTVYRVSSGIYFGISRAIKIDDNYVVHMVIDILSPVLEYSNRNEFDKEMKRLFESCRYQVRTALNPVIMFLDIK